MTAAGIGSACDMCAAVATDAPPQIPSVAPIAATTAVVFASWLLFMSRPLSPQSGALCRKTASSGIGTL